MSTITWLHLSDIHFHSKTEWRDNAVRGKLLDYLKDIYAKKPELKPDFIVCTGDIAYGEGGGSTMAEQYELAAKFFDQLLQCCGGLSRKKLFVVPGNHDVNRKEIDEMAQESLISRARDSHAHVDRFDKFIADNDKTFQNCMSRLSDYQSFIKNDLEHLHDDEGRCHYTRQLNINGVSVGIAGLNGVWTAGSSQDKGHLWAGSRWQFNHAMNEIGGCELRIALMHHPINWLTEAECNSARNRLSQDFHCFLHGHTHDNWVEASQKLVTLAAGATGADHDAEFGFNITQLDMAGGTAKTHLHTFDQAHHGWKSLSIPNHAPDAVWSYGLPDGLTRSEVAQPIVKAANQNSGQQLFGRNLLLQDGQELLVHCRFMLIYGMRGNGKSVFIDALSKVAPLEGKSAIRIRVTPNFTANMLYQQFATWLGDLREVPVVPSGSITDMKKQLNETMGRVDLHWVWLENAHLLLESGEFQNQQVKNLLIALQGMLPQWHWVLELRERPDGVTLPNMQSLEVPGLDVGALKAFFIAEAPEGDESWTFNKNRIKGIYQWLGGGQGEQAHPQATRLLIEVAKGLAQNPYDVLRKRVGDASKAIEKVLLNDLYFEVLNEAERLILSTIGLYRVAIPQEHIEMLEDKLDIPEAFDGIDRRCLVARGEGEREYYLHGFIAQWLCQQQGMSDAEEGFYEFDDERFMDEELVDKQSAIADCWIDLLQGRSRLTQPNIQAANEAVHHLLMAGESHRVDEISTKLLGKFSEEGVEKLYTLHRRQREMEAPFEQRIELLELLVKLKPEDPKFCRFLASALKDEYGWKEPKALPHFKKALELDYHGPQHRANYGRACLALDLGADFLTEVENYRREFPHGEGINDYVLNVEADCLKACGDAKSAFDMRQLQIESGSGDPVIYNDQAKGLMQDKQYEQALDVLALARKNEADDEFTQSMEARILDLMGDKEGAMTYRQNIIDGGCSNPVFYSDQAKAWLAEEEGQKALDVIEQANLNGIESDYLIAVKIHALDTLDRNIEAMALRQEKIDGGSKQGIFYSEQAKAYLNQDDAEQALAILDLARRNRAEDEYTKATRRRVLKALEDKR